MPANNVPTVLITGASSGFGSFLAHAFVRAGYAVVLQGKDEEGLRKTRADILEKQKTDCQIIIADLKSPVGLSSVKKAFSAYKINILINNAAVNPELASGKVVTEFEDINAVLSVNVSSAIALCYGAREYYKTTGGGTIININTVAGLRGSSHEPMYAASKFGLRGFSESVKEDWLKEGVKIIDVFPGALGTGMSAERADVASLINPEELAGFLAGLCSTKSFFVKELNVRRTIV